MKAALDLAHPAKVRNARSAEILSTSAKRGAASAARWAVLGVGLALATPAAGMGSGHGYAWGNSPEQARYAPSAAYAFNSAGGRILIQRSRMGSYQVTFAGLGGNGTAGGHVQVTAYGGGSESCKVASWDSGGADFVVNLRCHDVRGRPADSRYTVYVQWPSTAASLPTLEIPEASREILPNGNVRIEYSDGSSKLLFDGGFTITTPDGEARTLLFSTSAPVASPPAPPEDSLERAWLEFHSRSLLDTISTLVEFDQASIDNYLAAEGDVGVYDRIAKRRKTLEYMVSGL